MGLAKGSVFPSYPAASVSSEIFNIYCMTGFRAGSAECPANDPNLLKVSIASLICRINGDFFFQNQTSKLAATILHHCFLPALGAGEVITTDRTTYQEKKSFFSLCREHSSVQLLSVRSAQVASLACQLGSSSFL